MATFTRHFPYWPPFVPKSLSVPRTSIYYNLEVSATRYPDKAAIDYYGRELSYTELRQAADALAGWLQQRCGVRKGDRVLLFAQNGVHFIAGYYGILRADAVVVPVNPMNLTEELEHYVEDAGARVMITTQELAPRMTPLIRPGMLAHLIVGAHAEYLPPRLELPVPDFVHAPAAIVEARGVTPWAKVMAAALAPGVHRAESDDLAVMPYTSGTTGKPKGCMHTHSTVLATSTASSHWRGASSGTVALSVLPMFHVTGMQTGMNTPIQAGGKLVVMTRWDRECAAMQIARARVTAFTAITTMMVDFLGNPNLENYDLSSLNMLGGGGAAMPEGLAGKLVERLGLEFIEGYGLSETMAPTHTNPPHRPKRQCAGIPIFDTDARVIDPETRRELGPNEIGELVMHGPQIFKGYWNQPEATAEAFLEHDGKTFFRSGDLGYYDEEGYFFITDRLKRMINASGFKVWPAEVEAILYAHPDIREACVIGTRDPYRGETVKALIVLEPAARGRVKAKDITAWAHDHMAAFKVPRVVEFVDELPKTATGKVFWRQLQEAENRALAARA
ncbi:MAG TPA: long-chain fatty acid--CoA ligase [Burkholderiales bacterium]|nr:long-chain fatty acid--CoA ligase [Burkholderiales bacterium]